MSKFKIGQKVVALKSQNQGTFKKGDIVTVDGFTCCPKCGIECIYLLGYNRIVNSLCNGGCEYSNLNVRQCYNINLFAPLTSSTDAIEYKMKVSIPELLELTKLQEA